MENRGREPRVEGEEGRPVRDTTIIPVRGCVLDEDGDRGCGEKRTDFRSVFGGRINQV